MYTKKWVTIVGQNPNNVFRVKRYVGSGAVELMNGQTLKLTQVEDLFATPTKVSMNIKCLGPWDHEKKEYKGCGDMHVIVAKAMDIVAWSEGALIQQVMPYLNEDERELVISATCPNCWERLLGSGGNVEDQIDLILKRAKNNQ